MCNHTEMNGVSRKHALTATSPTEAQSITLVNVAQNSFLIERQILQEGMETDDDWHIYTDNKSTCAILRKLYSMNRRNFIDLLRNYIQSQIYDYKLQISHVPSAQPKASS